MALSEAEITAIISAASEAGDPRSRGRWTVALRRMLDSLETIEFQPGSASALVKLCEAGAHYGWAEWEASAPSETRRVLSKRAKRSLRIALRRSLERITGPCVDLERRSFELALKALGLDTADGSSGSFDATFLKGKPTYRLFSLFKKFPVLAWLWSLVIGQWHNHLTEVFARFTVDRGALSRHFFDGKALGAIVDMRCGLSDSHHNGRTVTMVQFESGRVIYKPRAGDGESQWHSLVEWMNGHAFGQKLRAGRVLRRTNHCWMEYIAPATWGSTAEARRFYERIGGMIAMAYLIRAVDCHRENIVAAGEYPVLVDADALWHVSSVTKTQDALSQLYRTGFFPNSDPGSLQSRSSALGGMANVAHHKTEILRGFANAWGCLLGSKASRNALARKLRQIRSTNRRWIYRATERYAFIREASIQPAVLRSRSERDRLIAQQCARDSVASAVVQAETEALKRLDIPYFLRRTSEQMPPESATTRRDAREALKQALSLIRK